MTSRIVYLLILLLELGAMWAPQTVAMGAPKPRALQNNIFWASIYPRVFRPITVDTVETPIQIRAFMYLNVAMWCAWSNYHPTAADFFGRTSFKRPASEHTLENKNTAMMFAILRIYEGSPPSFGGDSGMPEFRKFVQEQGYDPDDRSEDMTTPVGIGNREGRDVAKLMAMDGWNAIGDQTATQMNYMEPFQDYTNYAPRNPASEIQYPFRWQPVQESNGRGYFSRQEFVVPQIGSAIAFGLSPDEMSNLTATSPYVNRDAQVGGENPADKARLRSEAQKVFKRSMRLTQYQQVLAEYFDNKVTSFMTPVQPRGTFGIACQYRLVVLPNALNWGVDEDMIYGLGANIATFDSTVLAWKEKRRVDAIRPTGQTMQYLFGNRKFKVWGGIGHGPVKITAGEWQPYIRTMPHSEFPSGSSCLCWALTKHALVVTKGRNQFPFKFTIPRGSSKFYPNRIPTTDMTITINRLTDWAKLCAESRLWAGVHFSQSVATGEKLCGGLGRKSQDVVDKLLAGEKDETWMRWLPAGSQNHWDDA